MFGIRSALAIGLVTVLSAATPLGCGGGKLAKVEMPAAGVQLGYDLTIGRIYRGRLRHGETVKTDFGSINRSLECEIVLTVNGKEAQSGTTLVNARFPSIRLDWKIPAAGININEFIAGVTSKIQGMSIDFFVDATGHITHMPELPQNLPAEEKLVIQEVVDALESAFLVVPERPLRAGETWDDKESRGKRGKLGSFREGTIKTTLEGLFQRAESSEQVAKLVIETDRVEIITTQTGSHQNEWKGKTVALFSTTGSYLSQIDGEIRKFDPGTGQSPPSTTFSKVSVAWTKDAASAPVATAPAPAAPTPPGAEQQYIVDPCDPDYVGDKECTEVPPAGGPAPAQSAPPAAAPKAG